MLHCYIPESSCSWVDKEFETLPTRPQDQFEVKTEDIKEFRETIYPYWKGHSMEDVIRTRYGKEISHIKIKYSRSIRKTTHRVISVLIQLYG